MKKQITNTQTSSQKSRNSWILALAALVAIVATQFLVGCNVANRQPASLDSATLLSTESSDNGIIGGKAVSKSEEISTTTVQLLNVRKGTSCTGTIIAANIVLTAAHCTAADPTDIYVIFSTKIPQSSSDLRKMNVRRVADGATDPRWAQLSDTTSKVWGDIALLKFSGSLPLGYKAARVSTDESNLQDGMTVTLAGFGLIKGGPEVEAKELRKTSVTVKEAAFSSTEFLVDQTQGRGACRGDSGGPAYVLSSGKPVILGVTSRGEGDAKNDCTVAAVYTSVAAYTSWINETATQLANSNNSSPRIPQPAGFE